ncbi:hypothetical protein [Pseudomonas moorei]|uniref:hypothetical protein n=1 Tax=Pseudomonas moorei TaxID=395599 RepID=UPI0036F4486F
MPAIDAYGAERCDEFKSMAMVSQEFFGCIELTLLVAPTPSDCYAFLSTEETQ